MSKWYLDTSKYRGSTVQEFVLALSDWYNLYTQGKYYQGAMELEEILGKKAASNGWFEREDLYKIACWGGNQHGVGSGMRKCNSDSKVRNATSDAIRNLSDPECAFRALRTGIKSWGLSYASKTLRFICPQRYGALDSLIRHSLIGVLPRINNGHLNSEIRGYVRFLEFCEELKSHKLPKNPNRPNGEWYIADIEVALFQFASKDEESRIGVIINR